VSFELKDEVGEIDKKQDDSSSSGNRSDTASRVVAESLKGGRDDEGANGHGEHTGGGLGDGDVEVLSNTVDATKEEAHAQNQKQVGEHTADQRGLHNQDLVLLQSDDTDNQFSSVTETGIEKTSESFSSVESEFFGSKGQHGSQRDDGDKVDDKDGISVGFCVSESETDRDTDEQHIDP
jgi:hypothetical protein